MNFLKSIRLDKTFRYRNAWLGLAMLLIIMYHSSFRFSFYVLKILKAIGYFGVDICVFATGIGCYYSLDKDPDSLRFLQRRVKRLYPTYLCFVIPWMIWRNTRGSLPFYAVIANLLGIQSYLSWAYHFNWYIAALVLIYLLMPLFKKLADRTKNLWEDLLVIGFFLIASLAFCYNSSLIVMTRLPVLYLGVVYAKYAKRGCELTRKSLLLHAATLVLGLFLVKLTIRMDGRILWDYGLYWYPFILVVPGLCILFSYAISLVEKIRVFDWLYKFLCLIGKYSFEIYLVHLFLYEGLVPDIEVQYQHINNQLLWWCTIPVIVAGTFLLNRMATLFTKGLSKITVKRVNAE